MIGENLIRQGVNSRLVHRSTYQRWYPGIISILVPTKARPNLLRQLHDSAAETASGKMGFEIIAYIDEDESAYIEELMAPLTYLALFRAREKVNLSEMWNRCWELATGEIGMLCGDDIVFRTQGWDDMVREAFAQYPDRIAYVYGRDGAHDESLGTHGFLHRNWTDAVGYFVPPYFESGYNDVWLTEIAETIGRRVYLPDLYTEHMHPELGKREPDSVYHERVEAGRRENVSAVYHERSKERGEAVAALRKAIDDFAARSK